MSKENPSFAELLELAIQEYESRKQGKQKFESVMSDLKSKLSEEMRNISSRDNKLCIPKYKEFAGNTIQYLMPRIRTGKDLNGEKIDIERELMSPEEIFRNRVYEPVYYERCRFIYHRFVLTNMLVMHNPTGSGEVKLVKYDNLIAKKIINSCSPESKTTNEGYLVLTKRDYNLVGDKFVYVINDPEKLNMKKTLDFILNNDQKLLLANQILIEILNGHIPFSYNSYFQNRKIQVPIKISLNKKKRGMVSFIIMESADRGFYFDEKSQNTLMICKPTKKYKDLPFS